MCMYMYIYIYTEVCVCIYIHVHVYVCLLVCTLFVLLKDLGHHVASAIVGRHANRVGESGAHEMQIPSRVFV